MRSPITTVAILLGGCVGAGSDLDAEPRAESSRCIEPTFGHTEDLAASPRERPDLEALALDLGHDLTADPATYARLVRDTAAIERAVPEVKSLEPRTWQALHELRLHVDDPTALAIAEDHYEPWSCLNAHYDAAQVVVDATDAYVSFDGVYDMTLVAEDYGRLPGVTTAEPLQPIAADECGWGDAVCVDAGEATWTYVVHRVDSDCRHTGWRVEVEDGGAVRLVERVAGAADAQQPPWLTGCLP